MIENGLGDEILSGDEIRELLRDDPSPEPAAQASAGDELQSVLIVSRRRDDVSLLRDRLEAHGASVTVVRNPFAALDQLRTAHYRALVTDLGLWASGGLLLFERWRPLSSRPALVFVADRGEEAPETVAARLRRSGAVDVLFRPLRARDLEAAVLELLSRPRESPAPDRALPGDAGTAPGDEARPAEVDVEDAAASELGWLRLFFHASRMLRATEGVEPRLRALVALLDDHVGPSLAAAGWRDGRRSLLLASTDRAADARSALQSLRPVEEAEEDGILIVSGSVSLLLGGAPDAHRYRADLEHLLGQIEASRPDPS